LYRVWHEKCAFCYGTKRKTHSYRGEIRLGTSEDICTGASYASIQMRWGNKLAPFYCPASSLSSSSHMSPPPPHPSPPSLPRPLRRATPIDTQPSTLPRRARSTTLGPQLRRAAPCHPPRRPRPRCPRLLPPHRTLTPSPPLVRLRPLSSHAGVSAASCVLHLGADVSPMVVDVSPHFLNISYNLVLNLNLN
jgi:hypothetical protein